MFENYKVYEYEYAGRPLRVEVGKLAGLANGSALVRYGDTVLLCCATASAAPRDANKDCLLHEDAYPKPNNVSLPA